MGEVKVETGSTSSKISNISSTGGDVKLDSSNDSFSGTNIDPFTGFAGAMEILTNAVSNYNSIISQDAKAMQNAVDDFEDNDNDIANQINGNTTVNVNAF